VNFSHPLPLWEFALFFSTVKQALSNKTPCLAQPDNVPCFGIIKSGISFLSSLKIFCRLKNNRICIYKKRKVNHKTWVVIEYFFVLKSLDHVLDLVHDMDLDQG
jgi:hypothetical protein